MRYVTISLIALSMLAVSACGGGGGTTAVRSENKYTNEELARLDKAEPFPQLRDSADRKLQNIYYTTKADPNKLWYLTLVALDGTPYAHYTIRGGVASTGDQVTNPNQLYCQANQHAPDGCGVIGLAEPNGVYQGADDSHFALLTTGALIKWQGSYVVSDQPQTIKTPVKLSVDESQPISATDVTKSTGGIVPTGTGTRSK